MITQLPIQPMPAWLQNATNPLGNLPIAEVLKDSVYYPSCAIHGAPIRFLAGNFHSFIYVDYGIKKERLMRNLAGFRGYHVRAWREVTERELAPNGWTPIFPQPEDGQEPPTHPLTDEPPYRVWAILERDADQTDAHGPQRFSLLYICGDGVPTYQALYHGNNCYPAVVGIIQPGYGFGLNYTDFTDPEKIFARSVLRLNPAGTPNFLLYGGWGQGYHEPCWPQYRNLVAELQDNLRLWKSVDIKRNYMSDDNLNQQTGRTPNAWAQVMLDTLEWDKTKHGAPPSFTTEMVVPGYGCRDQSGSTFLQMRNQEQRVLHDALAGRINPQVLDYGSGIGRHAKFVRAIAPTSQLWLVENDPDLHNVCRTEFGANAVMSISEVPSNGYDLVILLGNNLGLFGTEHNTRENLLTFFKMLKPGGRLVGEFSSLQNNTPFVATHLRMIYKNSIPAEFDWGFMRRAWVEATLEGIGFKVAPPEYSGNENAEFAIATKPLDYNRK